MKLIVEKINDAKVVLTEGADNKKQFYIEGIFLQANIRNQNGRIYPLETLIKEVNRYKIEAIDRKRSIGELCHPDSPRVNPERASHLIVSLDQLGENFVGKAKVLEDMPMGKIVASLLREGVELGVSSRGMGTIREGREGSVVQEDYKFCCMDIVTDPSAPDAFVRGIMENKEWVWDNGIIKEFTIQEIKSEIEKVHNPNVSRDLRPEILKESFKRFLAGIGSNTRLKIS